MKVVINGLITLAETCSCFYL